MYSSRSVHARRLNSRSNFFFKLAVAVFLLGISVLLVATARSVFVAPTAPASTTFSSSSVTSKSASALVKPDTKQPAAPTVSSHGHPAPLKLLSSTLFANRYRIMAAVLVVAVVATVIWLSFYIPQQIQQSINAQSAEESQRQQAEHTQIQGDMDLGRAIGIAAAVLFVLAVAIAITGCVRIRKRGCYAPDDEEWMQWYRQGDRSWLKPNDDDPDAYVDALKTAVILLTLKSVSLFGNYPITSDGLGISQEWNEAPKEKIKLRFTGTLNVLGEDAMSLDNILAFDDLDERVIELLADNPMHIYCWISTLSERNLRKLVDSSKTYRKILGGNFVITEGALNKIVTGSLKRGHTYTAHELDNYIDAFDEQNYLPKLELLKDTYSGLCKLARNMYKQYYDFTIPEAPVGHVGGGSPPLRLDNR